MHVTSFCRADGIVANGNTHRNATELQTNCTSFSSMGSDDPFNVTANNGKILDFISPGAVIADILSLFFLPTSVQEAVKEPIDAGSNAIEELLHEAINGLEKLAASLFLTPIYAFFAIACGCMGILLCMLLAELAFLLIRKESLEFKHRKHAEISLAALSVFCLLLGSVILTVIELVVRAAALVAGVLKIEIKRGKTLVHISWAATGIANLLVIVLSVPFGRSDSACSEQMKRVDSSRVELRSLNHSTGEPERGGEWIGPQNTEEGSQSQRSLADSRVYRRSPRKSTFDKEAMV